MFQISHSRTKFEETGYFFKLYNVRIQGKSKRMHLPRVFFLIICSFRMLLNERVNTFRLDALRSFLVLFPFIIND